MEQVIKGLGTPLAPKALRFVQDIPKTRNAKLMRRVIRAAYLGEDPADLSAFLNPEAIEKIRNADQQLSSMCAIEHRNCTTYSSRSIYFIEIVCDMKCHILSTSAVYLC